MNHPSRLLLMHRLIFMALGALLCAGAVVAVDRVWAQEGAAPDQSVVAQQALAMARVLSYQGRLMDATTNTPRSDGTYKMDFRLYAAAAGGVPLWSETQNTPVAKGVFAVLLGSVAAFPPNLFNGQDLWLGVTVNNETEMTPRIRMAPVAYALYAENATSAINAASATNAANANLLDNQDSSAFAAAVHAHDGSAITSGTVAEPRIDGALARDSEVMPIVLAAGGSGSGLNADLLDGNDQSAFVKGFLGVQYDSSTQGGTALTPGAVQNVFSFGYSPNTPVLWFVRPLATAGRINLVVDIERGSDGNLTYWLRVTNTGSVTTHYQLVRQYLYN